MSRLKIVAPLILLTSFYLSAADGLTYQTPPAAMADLVNAPVPPSTSISPDNQWMILIEAQAMTSIADLAQEELRLAGLRMNPANFGPSRVRRPGQALTLMRIESGDEVKIRGVEAGKITNFSWSPDSKKFAFALMQPERITLWTGSVDQSAAKRITETPVNAVRGWGFYQWARDSKSLLFNARPEGQGKPPVKPNAPIGPNVQQTSGKKAAVRTFQDLIKNQYDESLFEYYMTGQLARVNLDGKLERLAEPALIRSFDISPDGRYILYQTIERPFSYIVPYSRFPLAMNILDQNGKHVKKLATLPLAEDVPKGFDSVRLGARGLGWRADVGATLVWAEAQDGGDTKAKAEVRDRVFSLAAPFKGEPKTLADLGYRYNGIMWGNGELAMLNEGWFSSRRIRTWLIAPDHPDREAKLMFDRSREDRYSDPGFPAFTTGPHQRDVMRIVDGRHLLMQGIGASPKGNQPFLRRLNVDTKETKTLWQSKAPYYERVRQVMDDKGDRIILVRESKDEPANLFMSDKGKLKRLTHNPHPNPDLVGLQKERISYKRKDGVDLTATLYLPPGYKKGDPPLPVLMWAYPLDYKSAEAASQVRDSPYQFVRVSYWTAMPFLLQGYAILDNPSMPIIGEGDKNPNDTYIEQLVSSAEAAVDEIVRRGVADRDRIAIGGHSYGAFMVANLLAHSDLFRAGIARSGAYNRTLTPFGFQYEQRSFWEAKDIYASMSSFFHADKIDEPLLLIHGEADNNSGTYPLQSERLFLAVKGLGGDARLVMLPHESHGYRARESILHMLWESNRWLEMHVMNAESRPQPTAEGGE